MKADSKAFLQLRDLAASKGFALTLELDCPEQPILWLEAPEGTLLGSHGIHQAMIYTAFPKEDKPWLWSEARVSLVEELAWGPIPCVDPDCDWCRSEVGHD